MSGSFPAWSACDAQRRACGTEHRCTQRFAAGGARAGAPALWHRRQHRASGGRARPELRPASAGRPPLRAMVFTSGSLPSKQAFAVSTACLRRCFQRIDSAEVFGRWPSGRSWTGLPVRGHARLLTASSAAVTSKVSLAPPQRRPGPGHEESLATGGFHDAARQSHPPQPCGDRGTAKCAAAIPRRLRGPSSAPTPLRRAVFDRLREDPVPGGKR